MFTVLKLQVSSIMEASPLHQAVRQQEVVMTSVQKPTEFAHLATASEYKNESVIFERFNFDFEDVGAVCYENIRPMPMSITSSPFKRSVTDGQMRFVMRSTPYFESIRGVWMEIQKNKLRGSNPYVVTEGYDDMRKIFCSPMSAEDMLGALLFNNCHSMRITIALMSAVYDEGDTLKESLASNHLSDINDYLRDMDDFMREQMFNFGVGLDEESKDFTRGIFSQFGEVTDSLLSKFKDIIMNIPEVRHKVSFSASSLLPEGFFEKCLNRLGLARDGITDWLNSPSGQLLVNVLALLGLIYVCRTYFEMTQLQANLVMMAVCVLLPSPSKVIGFALDFAWTDVAEAFSSIMESYNAEMSIPDGGMAEHASIASLGAPMKVLLGFVFGSLVGETWNKKGQEKFLDTFISKSAQFKKAKDSTESVLEFMFSVISGLMNFTGDCLNIKWLKEMGVKFPEVNEIAEGLADLVRKLRTGELVQDSTVARVLMDYEFRLRALSTSITKTKENDMYIREVNVLLQECRNLLDRNKGVGTNGGPRIEPTAVAMIGEPGLMKSMGIDLLAYDLIPMMLSGPRLDAFEKCKDNEVHVAHADQGDYWDGYTGQFCLKVDDIMQLKDAAGTPNPMVLTHIHSMNSSSWYPNFSSIQDKHGIPFSSQLIIATDNNLKISKAINSLNSNEAFGRRWDFTFNVTCKEKYAKEETKGRGWRERRLDMKWVFRIKDNALVPEDITDIWEFHDWDWVKGKEIPGGPYSYAEVKQMIYDRHKVKQKNGLAWLNTLTNMCNASIKKRREEIEEEKKLAEQIAQARADIEVAEMREQAGVLDFDPYEVLAVKPKFTHEELCVAYKKAALRCHPDKGGTTDDMMRVTAAFDILKNPAHRYEYDTMVGREEISSMTLERMLYLKRKWDKKPIDFEDRIKTFKDLEAFFLGERPPCYEENLLPSHEWINMLCEKTGLTKEQVYGYFYVQRWDPHTPIGDYVHSIAGYYLARAKKALDRTIRVCNGIVARIVEVLSRKDVIMAISAVAGLCGMMWVLMKPKLEEQTGTIKGKKVVENRAKYAPGTKGFSYQAPVLVDHGGSMSKSSDDVVNKVIKNVLLLRIAPDKEPFGMITMVKGKMGITVAHIHAKCVQAGVERIHMSNLDGDWDQWIHVKHVRFCTWTESLNEDEGYYYFPSLTRNFADIIHFYLEKGSKEDMIVHSAHFGHLIKPRFHSAHSTVVAGVDTVSAHADSFSEKIYGTKHWKAVDSIAYPIASYDGLCGATWMCTDIRVSRPVIAGYHCAGNAHRGAALIIYADTIRSAYEGLTDKYDGLPTVELQEDGTKVVLKEQSGDFPGIMPEQWKILKEVPYERINSKSGLVKTPLFEKWSLCDKRPALLHEINVRTNMTAMEEGLFDPSAVKPGTDKVSPWWNAWKPYGLNTLKTKPDPKPPGKRVNVKALTRIAIELSKNWKKKFPNNDPWPPKVFGYEEAVEGYPGVMKGVPRNTSAGFPWNKKSKKKYGYFGTAEDYEFCMEEGSLHKELYDTVVEDIEMLKRGEMPEWIYQQFLKDELRSLKKTFNGLTRLVMGSPLNKTIVTSMYFKDFMRYVVDNNIFNGFALGVDPTSVDWKILADYLLSVGNCMIDGDFKHFDCDILEEFDDAWLIVVEGFYYNSTEEDRRIRRMIMKDTGHSRHLVTVDGKSYIAQIDDICPSGDLLTGNKQTGVNKLISRYATMDLIMREQGYANGIDDYDDDTEFDFDMLEWNRFIGLGDDHVISVCEYMQPFMTQKSYGEAVMRIGFTYTDAKKTGELIDGHRPLQDVSFLKRSFSKIPYFPGEVFGALDLEVILEMPYWLDKKAPLGTLEAVLDTVGKELSARPGDYNVWAPKIGAAAMKYCNYRSPFLPINGDVEEVCSAWRRAITAFRSMQVEYTL